MSSSKVAKAKRIAKLLVFLTTLLFLMALSYRWLGAKIFVFQPKFMEERQDSRLFRDVKDKVFWAEMTQDEHWQLKVSLDEVSPYFIKAILATEDKRFYKHDGVDYIRLARATFSNIFGGRIVSGASTVSMQVVRLSGDYERSIPFKIKQFALAWSLESQRSKEWILTEYMNNLPFGSNLRGVEAASRFYFDKSAKNLTLWEASLLAGIPQSPSRYRPDRYAQRCAKRQGFVLWRLLKEGWISRNDYHSCVRRLYVRTTEKRKSRLGFVQQEELLYRYLRSRSEGDVKTSVNLEDQQEWRRELRNYLKSWPGVEDAAMVLIDNETGELKLLLGTLDEQEKSAGKVNVALQKRSTGSTLKPFIYLCAIQEGRLIAESKLLDAEIDISSYRPENFSGDYLGEVTMAEALRKSLNTPAVRVLKSIGLESFSEKLLSLSSDFNQELMNKTGLSIALGGHEMSLLDLTKLYSFLAKEGEHEQEHNFNKGSIQLLNKILSDQKMKGLEDYQIAWKTGTSNAFKDAWCMAYNRRYTVGLWFGNKSGRSNENLIGSRIALPFMGRIFQSLYKAKRQESFFSETDLLKVEHGELAGFLKPKGIVLRRPKRAKQAERSLVIIQPMAGKIFKKTGLYKMSLEANKKQVRWFVNGEYQQGDELDLAEGHYRIDCYDEGNSQTKTVEIEVI